MVPGQLPLQGAGVVDLLHKVRLAHLDLVKNLKADALPHQAAFAGDLDALVVHGFLGHHDGAAFVGNFIGNFVGLQSLEHHAGVFGSQVGIEHAVVRPAQPDRKAQGPGHEGRYAAQKGKTLPCLQARPEIFEGGQELGKKSRHGPLLRRGALIFRHQGVSGNY